MRPWLHYLASALAGVALLAAAAVAVAPHSLKAAEAPAEPARSISVTGRASIEVRPDVAVITFGVSTLAPAAGDAYARMAQSMGDVVAAMKQLSVPEADIQTSGLSLGAEYRWDKDGEQQLLGYRASNRITVTTRQLERIGTMIDTAVAAGANSVSGVEFDIRNAEAYSGDVLDRAAADARAKAERVAARLGAVVTGVTHIQVLDGGTPPPRLLAGAGMAAPSAALPVLAGTSRFEAAVSVEFSIAPAPPSSS